MTLAVFKSAVRDNWYFLVIIGLLLAAAAYKSFVSAEAPQEDAFRAAPVVASQASGSSAPLPKKRRPPRPTAQEKAQTIIGEHQERLDEDPDSEEAPALLKAMGNLARQKLRDYEQAVDYYEQILDKYPDWEGTRQVYAQLALCYERMGDQEGAAATYVEMMEELPEDSDEYQFAKMQLAR